MSESLAIVPMVSPEDCDHIDAHGPTWWGGEPARCLLCNTERPDESLDAAWADARLALPDHCSLSLHLLALDDWCEAVAGEHGPHPTIVEQAPTPAAALRALAAKLREVRDPKVDEAGGR